MAIQFPESLPITQKLDEISKLLAVHQVLIVAGETGSGKSTQLPKICLHLDLAKQGKIGHTQPRRLAARNVAARVAEELQVELGSIVGYQVRFHDQFNDQTKIKVMTDGILLAEIQQDRLLRQYDVLIIDEAHERSLNIDFLLGYLKQLLPQRPELKVIITSATIDHIKFSQHFNNAPIVEVSGRTFPVETRYRPLADEEELDQVQGIIKAVDELSQEGNGDILVFLSTEREIHETAEALRKYQVHYEVLPLYARLTMAEQQKAFHPGPKRRVILSTNVAETSITVPRIHYVIDTGYARLSRYNYKNKVQRLPIEAISQASANQRAGRCGRIAPGVCIRLYSETDFASRSAYTEPEILRTNLAAIILQMAVFRLGKIEEFPFINPPDSRFINDGYKLLLELGAIDYTDAITPIGRMMARFSIDPRLSRMIIAAAKLHCLREVLIIVSGLSVQDPRERPKEYQQQADQAQQIYQHAASDFFSLVNLWDHYHHAQQAQSKNKMKSYCKAHFLSQIRMREWTEVYRQLLETCQSLKWQVPIKEYKEEWYEFSANDSQRIHQALLTGSLSLLGQWLEERTYLGPRNIKFQIFPGSKQAKRKPKWLMCASFIETTQIYALTVAKIESDWVEKLAPNHLLKRSYSEPHWEKDRSQAVAFEKVTLYGLEIVTKRKVNYARIDPKLSRELFIRHALVMGEFKSTAKFIINNRQLLEEAEELEHKGRRRGIVVNEHQLFEFYDERVPKQVVNGIEFDKWVKTLNIEQQLGLFLSEQDVVTDQAHLIKTQQFPDIMQIAQIKLPLAYRFEPDHIEDGVTLKVPLSVLNQLPEEACQWLVPGLLKEKLTELIRGLPKSIRRNFVPAPNFAEACLERLLEKNQSESLFFALSQELKRMTGVTVPEEIWYEVELPPHLLINIQIIDNDNQIVRQGRDLKTLKQFLAGEMQETAATLHSDYEQTGLIDWSFGDLPESVTIRQGKLEALSYLAIIAEENSVGIQAVPNQIEAERLSYKGLRMLFMLQCKKELKELKSLQLLNSICIQFATVIPKQELISDFVAKVFDRVFLSEGLIRTQATYIAALSQRGHLYSEGQKLLQQLGSIANAYKDLVKELSRPLPAFSAHFEDMHKQLNLLVYPDFMQETPDQWFKRLAIYIQAISKRLQKLRLNPEKDRQSMIVIQDLTKAYASVNAIKKQKLDAENFNWLIQELRVSLFAQELKTAVPVSEQRLKKLLIG